MKDPVITITDFNIPKHKIKQFQEILIACNGYFRMEPFLCFNTYHVTYSFTDTKDRAEFNKRWRAATEDVVEKVRPKRHLGNLFGLLWWKR